MEVSDGSQESSELTAGPKAKSYPNTFLNLSNLQSPHLLNGVLYLLISQSSSGD